MFHFIILTFSVGTYLSPENKGSQEILQLKYVDNIVYNNFLFDGREKRSFF